MCEAAAGPNDRKTDRMPRPDARRGRLRHVAVLVFMALFATACATRSPAAALVWSGSRQLVLVTTPSSNADRGTLRRFERDADDGWRRVGEAAPVTVGRAGIAWGDGLHPVQPGEAKQEGDGRAPAGVFRIGHAFGYAPSFATALPYVAMDAGDWCIDVPGSPLYNRIVDVDDVGQAAIEGSTEPMRRDIHVDGDQRYRLGFVIEHNTAAVPRRGSCIFAHEWASPTTPTAGCTAMAPATMETLLGWLDPAATPVFVLLTDADHARLRADWHLPPTDD